MKHFNILNRRAFLSQSFKTSMAVALSTLVDIPFVMKRALAEGSIGLNGKKILFIWLRGANDGLNSVIPVEDPTYYSIRQQIAIQKEAAVNYAGTTGGCFDATQYSSDAAQTQRTAEHCRAVIQHRRESRNRAEEAERPGARRVGLDRDEGAREGPQSPIRDRQQLCQRCAALPG